MNPSHCKQAFMTLFACSFPLMAAATQISTSPKPLSLGEVTAVPAALFRKESTAVVFQYVSPIGHLAHRPLLAQIDEQGHPILRLGVLGDDGLLGDQKAGDGVYSRKFQLNQKKAGVVYYQIQDGQTEAALSAPLAIEVVRHPAFQELLSQIWKGIRARLN